MTTLNCSTRRKVHFHIRTQVNFPKKILLRYFDWHIEFPYEIIYRPTDIGRKVYIYYGHWESNFAAVSKAAEVSLSEAPKKGRAPTALRPTVVSAQI